MGGIKWISDWNKSQKNQMIENIKGYFEEEHGENLGNLAAENFLDFITKEIGPYFYNQGLDDAGEMVDQKLVNMEEDIQSLKKAVHHFGKR
ncbi:DUF2164 domain-containing protein [Virgibacillus sediminis]|uniref:DUF2164 domain-containing protein n=1 Tax=Virgibacillus sediminis TaxID=202260 RepID=A0ABV7A9X0_9BACI